MACGLGATGQGEGQLGWGLHLGHGEWGDTN
jgi:hypothetical protein